MIMMITGVIIAILINHARAETAPPSTRKPSEGDEGGEGGEEGGQYDPIRSPLSMALA